MTLRDQLVTSVDHRALVARARRHADHHDTFIIPMPHTARLLRHLADEVERLSGCDAEPPVNDQFPQTLGA